MAAPAPFVLLMVRLPDVIDGSKVGPLLVWASALIGSIHSTKAKLTSSADSLLNDFFAFMLKSPFRFLV